MSDLVSVLPANSAEDNIESPSVEIRNLVAELLEVSGVC